MKKDINTTILVTAGILLGSFFSYLLQFYLGRTLSVSEYGAFNTLLSVAALFGVPATVFGTALIKEVSSLSAKNENQKVDALFWQSMIWSAAAGFVIFAFFTLFNDTLSSLQITNTKLISAFAFYLSLTFLWSVPYAYFQGLLEYKLFTVFVVTSSLLRFTFPVFYLISNKQLSGIFMAMALATCVIIVLSTLLLKRPFRQIRGLSLWKELLEIVKFSLPVMFTNVCLMSFNNNDLILVRRFFSPDDSGYYAGTVTLGKILLFGTSAVATVMFPKISGLKSKGENVKKMFLTYLKMQLGLVGIGLVVFAIFPKLIATAFFGTKFLASVKYLPLLAVFISLYVLLNFLIMFLFAVDITSLYYYLFLLVISQTILISKFHSSIFQVILVNISIISVALTIASIYSYNFFRSTHRPAKLV